MPEGARYNEAISVSRAESLNATMCFSFTVWNLNKRLFKTVFFCFFAIVKLWLKEWYYGSMVAQWVSIQAAAKHKNELSLHIASVCVCSLTNVCWQQSPSDKSLFNRCLRLSTYYGSWQFRTKLFTVKRNLPQACSCVNGEKMTGTLTANTVELLQDVARKKGAYLFLSSLIYRGRNVWV